MSTRYSRGHGSGGQKPHQRSSGRPRQTDEVTLNALLRGKPRHSAETTRTSGAQDSREFQNFLKKALANAPTDRRTRPLARHELNELYGEDISHIRHF